MVDLFTRDAVQIDRRRLFVFGGQLGLLAILLGRLQYLQIAQSTTYKTLADDNRVNVSLLAPIRGVISDRKGVPIALNERNFQVRLVPEQIADLDETLRRLSRIIDLSERRREWIMERVARSPSFVPITIADFLQWESFARLNTELPYLPGVEPYVGERRYYNFGARFAHIVGYVGESDTKLPIADMKIGKSGLERSLEEALRGQAGAQSVEVNAVGRVVRELSYDRGQAGANVELTIDADLQNYVYERFGDASGVAIVQEIDTGDVLAMVSAPSFDPNQLVEGISEEDWQILIDNERKPLLNKAVRGLYAPGSLFKMLLSLAALERGVIRPDQKIMCDGRFTVAREKFHCWVKQGHGEVNMVEALERSCDVYFYELAMRTGIDDIERMAKRFGLGLRTGLELAGEKAGVVPSRDWKRANLTRVGGMGIRVNTGIGQGYMLATPLQMLGMMARLASRGRGAKPRLVRSVDGVAQEIQPYAQLDFKQRDMDVIHQGMRRVVNTRWGTAYHASLLVNGARMAGKTGTVQVRRISDAERRTRILRNRDLPWHLRDHALFAGYAPMRRPKYALMVLVEHGGSGGLVAAPMARDIMVEVLRREEKKSEETKA